MGLQKILNMKIKFIKQCILFGCIFMVSCSSSECEIVGSILTDNPQPQVRDFKKYGLVLTENGYKIENPFISLGQNFWSISSKRKKHFYIIEDNLEEQYSTDEEVISISMNSDSNLNFIHTHVMDLYRNEFQNFDSCIRVNNSDFSIIYRNHIGNKILSFNESNGKTKVVIYY